MIRKLIVAIVAFVSATSAFAQSAPLILKSGRISQPAATDSIIITPSYPGLNASRRGFNVNIGGCLSTDYLSGAPSNFTSAAIAGCIVQPAGTYTGSLAGWPDAALAGYMVTSNANSKTAVGVYGNAGTTVSGSGLYGANFNTVNCRLWASSCAPGGGFDFSVMYGLEVDVNSYSKSGSVAPSGAARGLIVHLNGDATPSTSAQAYDLTATGGAQWGTGYTTEAAATTIGMFLNSVSPINAAGNSQSIQFISRTSGGASTTTTVLALPGGALSVSSPVVLPLYTVATLPTCNAALKAGMAYVTDATAPTYNGALTGGGAVGVPAVCNGTAWSSH